MAFFAHMTYCPNKENSFFSEGFEAWSLFSQEITLASGPSPALIIQFKGQKLTYEEMQKRDETSGLDFEVPFPGLLGSLFKVSVPRYAFEKYFAKANQEIMKSLIRLCQDSSHDKMAFLFTGHGEGGAIAIYAAWFFSQERIAKKRYIEVTTFGSPRIFGKNSLLAASIKFPINRVTNTNDYVPLFLGKQFQHTNTEYWILFEDECECPSPEHPRMFPQVFNCFTKVGTENPECNLRFQKSKDWLAFSPRFGTPLNTHLGRYFGYTMGKCIKAHKNWLPPFQ
ncbi:hypothetical protein G9A89_016920 [Geosiphon pyriformis]|nr:hypothetical protein G9A89_016920 [Geosiphon pyriformis]